MEIKAIKSLAFSLKVWYKGGHQRTIVQILNKSPWADL